MKNKKTVLKASIVALAVSFLICAAVFAVNSSQSGVFGDEFNKEMFTDGDAEIILENDYGYYGHDAERDMYAVVTSGDGWRYRTFMDKNGDCCFMATEDGGATYYIDYPNDGKGAQLRYGDTYELVPEVEVGIWEKGEIDSEYELYPKEKGELRGSSLTEKDAVKINAISIIHDDSVRIFKDIMDD